MKEIEENSKLTLLLSGVESSKNADLYGGVMSDQTTLISNGDFVTYSDDETAVTTVSYYTCTQLLL